MNSLERIKEEYNDFIENPLYSIGVSVSLPDQNNYYEWKIMYLSPKDSLYAGGVFSAKLLFPNDYPNSCLKIIFLTPIYHLNVNPKKSESESLGKVMLNVTNLWNPGTTVREVLARLYSIFYFQNSDAAYGVDRAKEYIDNRTLFELKAKFFTQKYAKLKNGFQQFDDKDWDFSCSEKDLELFKCIEKQKEWDNSNYINLDFTYNGKTKTTIQCGKDELIRNVIKKGMNKLGISENLEKLLIIFSGKKIDLNFSVEGMGLKNNSNIAIIYDGFF